MFQLWNNGHERYHKKLQTFNLKMTLFMSYYKKNNYCTWNFWRHNWWQLTWHFPHAFLYFSYTRHIDFVFCINNEVTCQIKPHLLQYTWSNFFVRYRCSTTCKWCTIFLQICNYNSATKISINPFSGPHFFDKFVMHYVHSRLDNFSCGFW